VDSYYRKRIELVRGILPLVKEAEQESWYKQYFDNLTAMAQNSGDKAAMGMLLQMKDDVATKMPASNLAPTASIAKCGPATPSHGRHHRPEGNRQAAGQMAR